MKLFILPLFVFLYFSKPLSAQTRIDTVKSSVFTERFYLKKSKQQKNLAVGALVTGGAVALIGGYLWFMAPIAGLSESGNVEGATRTGKALTFVGASVAAVSIPLFIASSKNKRNAVLYTGTSNLSHPVLGSKQMLAVGMKWTID